MAKNKNLKKSDKIKKTLDSTIEVGKKAAEILAVAKDVLDAYKDLKGTNIKSKS